MKKLPVLAEFHYDRVGSFRNGNPFVIAFCYTDPKWSRLPAFIIKGGSNEVSAEIKKRKFPMLVYTTYWRHKQCRTFGPHFENCKEWSINGSSLYITKTDIWKIEGRSFYRGCEVRCNNQIKMIFRRIPRKWLPEYTAILNGEK
jgi:hypothetical protein